MGEGCLPQPLNRTIECREKFYESLWASGQVGTYHREAKVSPACHHFTWYEMQAFTNLNAGGKQGAEGQQPNQH
jgi:hypothetical protein